MSKTDKICINSQYVTGLAEGKWHGRPDINPNTTIEYYLPKPGSVNLSVFTLNGKLVEILETSDKNPGIYKTNVSMRDLASGIYFYVLDVDGTSISKKMIYVK